MQDTELRTSDLPAIPGKRYFTIGEVSELCMVKTHVLRYWEQEFNQLSPVRRGNRRYYRQEDVQLVREIRHLLYEQRFTIDGARSRLKRSVSQATPPQPPEGELEQIVAQLQQVIELLEDDA